MLTCLVICVRLTLVEIQCYLRFYAIVKSSPSAFLLGYNYFPFKLFLISREWPTIFCQTFLNIMKLWQFSFYLPNVIVWILLFTSPVGSWEFFGHIAILMMVSTALDILKELVKYTITAEIYSKFEICILLHSLFTCLVLCNFHHE